MFLAVTFGVGLAAVNTGNNLLYLVLGLMLSLLLVSGTLSDVALWRAKIERVLPKRAQVGRPSVISLRLSNDKPVPAYAVEIEDLALDEDHAERRCFFLKVAARGEQTATYRRVPTRRGWLRFERMMLRTRYPFGLIEKGWPQRVPGELLVYPAVVPVDVRRILGGAEGLGTPDRRLGRGAEIDGLREHREGDEARSIHWRRSAALDRLVVREHAAEARARLTLLLDEARPSFDGFAGSAGSAADGVVRSAGSAADGVVRSAGSAADGVVRSAGADEADAAAWDEGFEVAVSEAASLAYAALEAGAAVEVRTRRGASPLVLPGSPADPILRFLALLEPTPSHEAPPLTAPRGSVVHRIAVSFGSAQSTSPTTSTPTPTSTSTPTPTSTSTSPSTTPSTTTSTSTSTSSSAPSSEAE